MRKIVHTLVLFFSFSGTTFSQVDFSHIQLDSFRMPDIDRWVLEVDASFAGSYRDLNTETNSFFDSPSYSVSPRGNLRFSRYVNRADIQRNSSGAFLQYFRTAKNAGFPVNITKSLDYDATGTYSEIQRKYRGQQFLLTGGSGRVSYSFDRLRHIDSLAVDFERGRHIQVSAGGSIGFGHGRIEPISDVTTALFLLQDANALGLDLSDISQDDAFAFAARMAVARNQRIFDVRRMRVQELRDLYAFMQQRDWVVANDPGFFTVLTDNWLYNALPSRFAGKRWTFTANPGITYLSERSTYDLQPGFFESSTLLLSGYLEAEFQKDKPRSLHHDIFRRHSWSAGVNATSGDEFVTSAMNSNFIVATRHTLGRRWIPNNRTAVIGTLGLDLSYREYLTRPPFSIKKNQSVAYVNASLSSNYFISYRTRFTVGAELQYGYSDGGFLSVFVLDTFATNAKANGFAARLNAGLFVAIF
jgi:hypothetical protein